MFFGVYPKIVSTFSVLNRAVNSCSYSSEARKKLYVWGHAKTGSLGSSKSKWPVEISPLEHEFSSGNTIVDASCGFGFTLLTVKSQDTKKVYGCGVNTDSQISGCQKGDCVVPKLSPITLELGESSVVSSVNSGRGHCAVVSECDGTFMFGNNSFGQCGMTVCPQERCEGKPKINQIKFLGGETIDKVFCGMDHTIFLTKGGKVFACGFSAEGQTGLNSTDDVGEPCALQGDICGERIVKIATKADSCLALSESGKLFGWGSNEYQQLTSDAKEHQINAPKCLSLDIGTITDIASGGSFSLVLNDCGDVYAWGYGILGTGTEPTKCPVPTKIPKECFPCGVKINSIDCSVSYIMATSCDGQLFAWGKNRFGCLGIGHSFDQYFPMKVPIKGKVKKVSCGFDHALALVETC